MAGLKSSIANELRAAGDRDKITTQPEKKNYAEALSRQLSVTMAQALRGAFPGILPDEHGIGQESRARTAKGFKKLDVNYSTTELGLGLGVSIKTVNFRDKKSGRYTKNFTRADGELRAEASDYHERQPWAVMVALVFMPIDACDDGTKTHSSFGQAVQIYRLRGNRTKPNDPPLFFEGVFIGLYDTAPETFGDVVFFDVVDAPPRNGRPRSALTLGQLIERIVAIYDARNNPVMRWADAAPEHVEIKEDESGDE